MKIKVSSINKAIIILGLTICVMLNSSYAYCLVSDTWTLFSLFLCFIVCVIACYVKKGLFKKSSFYTSPIVVLSFVVVISMILHFDFNSWGSYAHQVIVLFLAAIIAYSIPVNRFAKVFVEFMAFVTVVALVMWVLVNLANVPLPLPIMTSKGSVFYPDYYNGIIFFMNTTHTLRVQGPFWEAGIYAASCVLALFFVEYSKEEIQHINLKRILFIIGIILSMSTTGYILLALYVLFQAIKYRQGYASIIVTCLISIPLIIGVLYQDQMIAYLSLTFPDVFGKLTYENYSVSTRLMGPLLDLKIMKNNPFLGVGMTRYIELWPSFASQMSVESRTSTITYFLANFGILGITYLIALIKAARNQKKISTAGKIIILVVLVCIVTSEPNYFNLLTTICIVYLCRDAIPVEEQNPSKVLSK